MAGGGPAGRVETKGRPGRDKGGGAAGDGHAGWLATAPYDDTGDSDRYQVSSDSDATRMSSVPETLVAAGDE